MKRNGTLCIGLPQGSLHEATLSLFKRAGFDIAVSSRSYKPTINSSDFQVRLLRAQEIAKYVEQGFLDIGVTGLDWILESNSKVHRVCELPYNKVTSSPAKWVLVVPEDSPIKSPKHLKGKRIAAEAVNLTKNYLKRHKIEAHVQFSWGATEVKVPELVDAIVDITETGSSIRANKLRIIDTILESYPQLIANHEIWKKPDYRRKINGLATLLTGAINARNKVGLKMNLKEKDMKRILTLLPALRNPTVSQLTLKGWIAIETIIDEDIVREIIPRLKELGAEGIVEYPLNKVVY
jgi:ATP phosphoribosyltransferase